MNDADVSARPRTDWATWWETFSETVDAVRAGIEAVRETLESANRRTAEECYLKAFGQAMDVAKFAMAQLLTLRHELDGAPPDPVAELEEALVATGHTMVTFVRGGDEWWCESRLPVPYRNESSWSTEAQSGSVTGPSLAAALRLRLEEVLELQLAAAAATQTGRRTEPPPQDELADQVPADAAIKPELAEETTPSALDAAANPTTEEIPF